jgi:hypothetical protein
VRPHLLESVINKGALGEVKTCHASCASLAVAASVSQSTMHLESDDIAVRVWRDDDISASADDFDGALNPAGFVDGVL